jgi:hypothetical protein
LRREKVILLRKWRFAAENGDNILVPRAGTLSWVFASSIKPFGRAVVPDVELPSQ